MKYILSIAAPSGTRFYVIDHFDLTQSAANATRFTKSGVKRFLNHPDVYTDGEFSVHPVMTLKTNKLIIGIESRA